MTLQRRTERSVDWAALRRRLDEAHAALERTDQPNADATRSILERRAARLAEPIVTDEKGDTYQVITFRLGSETCAIDARFVLNVFRLRGLALLPGAPAPVHGVTMWRGEVLTLLDLRGMLGMSTGALTDLGRVIVLGRSRAAFGFLADSVSGVRALSRGEVHASPGQTVGRHALVHGITSDAILVLDGEQVLGVANIGA
jgi:purine-binding chemotaxis protein CheW